MNKKVLVTAILFGSLTVSGIMSAQSVYPGQHQGKLKKETVAPLQAESFDLKDCFACCQAFRDNMLRDSAWMTSIDVNRLLHSFRTNCRCVCRTWGRIYDSEETGWLGIAGLWTARTHNRAFTISLCAHVRIYRKWNIQVEGRQLVTGLAEVQAALGNGYLSAYPEELINRNIRGTSVWAPWYTLHKLFSGLIDQYLYADNKPALEVVTRMGDWAYNKLKPLDEATRKRMIRNEFGGVNESFL